MRIGGHLPTDRPLERADELGIEVLQLHLSSPRTWKPPVPRVDAEELAASGRVAAVHAPYLCNPASGDPQVRQRTREMLQATLDAAPSVAAAGVVVHAGHATSGGTVEVAIERWLELLGALSSQVPVWIENTASGSAAPGRHLQDVARLAAALAEAEADVEVGWCLDTAHAFAGDPTCADDPSGWVAAFAEAVGGVDLLHVNDSAVGAGAGRDRHANLGAGLMTLGVLADMIAASGAPVAILETPGYDDRRAQDVEILRFLVEERGA